MDWAAPLLILPGVGLLVMSTSIRYTRLHDELHHLEQHPESMSDVRMLVTRGRLLRNALTCLYASAMCLSLGGLLGFIWRDILATSIVAASGVGLVMASCLALCLEAARSFRVLADEAEHLTRRMEVPSETAGRSGDEHRK